MHAHLIVISLQVLYYVAVTGRKRTLVYTGRYRDPNSIAVALKFN